jgi:AcrR family transcriptional regulator
MFAVHSGAMTPENRQRILEAAARVYAECGFRGATTRRIAQEAGVNEVTIFRIFRSKAALIAEALHGRRGRGPDSELPEVPVDPEREIERWSAGQLTHLRVNRSVIRKTMGDLEERPELADCASEGPTCAHRDLTRYLHRLQGAGFIDDDVPTGAAAAMLLGALFADAMGRDAMPEIFPQPAEEAPLMYAQLFLRAIRCRPSADAQPQHRRASTPSGRRAPGRSKQTRTP